MTNIEELFNDYHLKDTVNLYTKETTDNHESILDYWTRFYSKHLQFFKRNPNTIVNYLSLITVEHILTNDFHWLVKEDFSAEYAVGLFKDQNNLHYLVLISKEQTDFELVLIGFSPELAIFDVKYRKATFNPSNSSLHFLETEGMNLSPYLFSNQSNKHRLIWDFLLVNEEPFKPVTKRLYINETS